MNVLWESCCGMSLYTFPLRLLIPSNGRVKLTLEISIPITYIVTAFLLKASGIKLINQVLWTINNIPKAGKISLHSSFLQVHACYMYIFDGITVVALQVAEQNYWSQIKKKNAFWEILHLPLFLPYAESKAVSFFILLYIFLLLMPFLKIQ